MGHEHLHRAVARLEQTGYPLQRSSNLFELYLIGNWKQLKILEQIK